MRLTENMGLGSRLDAGRGLVEIEFRQAGQAWNPCTGLGAQGSKSVTFQLDPNLDIGGFVLYVRANYGVTDLQLVYRDGSRTPRAFILSDMLCHTDDFQTHVSILPPNETFAGLWLRVQGRAEQCTTGYGIVDAAVMRTGWMTYNPAWASTFTLRWPDGGVEAIILREQTTDTASYGVVDVAIRRPGGMIDCLTSNPAFTREHIILTHGRSVSGVQGWEQPYRGLIDLRFLFGDGSQSPCAFTDSLQRGGADGIRTWERTLPPRSQLLGFDARDQPHFGVVDFLLALGPDPLLDAPADVGASSEPSSPRRGETGNDQWLVVDQDDGSIWLGRVLISGRPVLVERSVEHRGQSPPLDADQGGLEDLGDGVADMQHAEPPSSPGTPQVGPDLGARARSRSGGARPPSPSGLP